MKLTHKQGRGKKIHIMLDDEYRITTDVDFWLSNYIKDGTEIDEDEWNELVDKINYRKAINKCYDLLSRRDHSVKELRDKLLRVCDENNADRAVDRMLELGYLDDEKYAHILLSHLLDNKKMSKSFIKQEMRKRGISADIISTLFEENDIDNVASAVELIRTKYSNKLRTEGAKEKVVAALMRKGFSYSDVKSAFELIENDEI